MSLLNEDQHSGAIIVRDDESSGSEGIYCFIVVYQIQLILYILLAL